MKIDLHVHTSEVSRCGKLPARDVVNIYKELGYDAICITNHFSTYTKGALRAKGHLDFIKAFEDGYQLARAEGEKIGLLVFRGYEFRCNRHDNDFLIYHLPSDLLEKFDEIVNLPITDCLKQLRNNGVKIYQAQPFRTNSTLIDPSLLDGIEIFNGSNGISPINDMAKIWAKAHPHLRGISGSDCHQTHTDIFDNVSGRQRQIFHLLGVDLLGL